MKNSVKIFITVLPAIVLFTNCRQQNKPVTERPKPVDLNSVAGFYKRFEGTIAGQQVVMQLHKYEKSYTGIFYYRNTGGWVYLSTDRSFGDSVLFNEFPEGNTENMQTDSLHARWQCKLQKDLLTGSWISADKKITYNINLKEVYPPGSFKFNVDDYTDSVKAFPAKKQSPFAKISCSLVTSANDWLNNHIKTIVSFDTVLNFTDGFNQARNQYFTEYKKTITDDYDSSTFETFNYSQSGNIYVRYNENNLVILESATYEYSGGAHGNYGSTFYCFDVQARRQLQLSDILSADSVTLQHFTEKYFRIQYHVKSDSLGEVLFQNHLAANNNFYFNEKGISFLYNPYEVASYAQGEIIVFIPFLALQKFIRPAFIKRINIIF